MRVISKYAILKKDLNFFQSCFRYQSGDQTPASEAAGPTEGAKVPPGDLDVKSQILQQQELQKQASAAAKSKGNSAPTSPMKDGKRASFFGKVIQEMNQRKGLHSFYKP